ncbi:MAG: hypothetical protein SFU87_00690 [Chitinophagaceae bacterium]|nr:hypothetical protein [Chitinophagaceae bacterium]
MTWIFLVSVATAVLAFLSGYLQYREKIEATQKNLKKEQELNEIYKKLQEKSDEIISLQTVNQEKTDQLVEVQKKLQEKSDELVNIQTKSLNELTGGNSYPRCHLPISNDASELFVKIFNHGEYTIDKLIIKIIDIGDYRYANASEILTQFAKFGMSTQNVPAWPSRYNAADRIHVELIGEKNFDILKPKQEYTFTLPIPKNDFQGYNILCQSTRKDWVILLRLSKYESEQKGLYPKYKAVYKVLRIERDGYSELFKSLGPYDGFPLNNKGEIKWFNSELQMKW